jgi:phosphocarrier protein
MAVIAREATIVNPLGMHARPAAEFVKVASRFRSKVDVRRDDMTVNGKSIMGVMMLAAECGATLFITTDGEDAEQAMDALQALVAAGFKEMHYTGTEADDAVDAQSAGDGGAPA